MAQPDEGTQPAVTTRDDVVRLYRTHLGRDPENEGAINGRLGLPLFLVESQIANSEEARLVRKAREATEPTKKPDFIPPIVKVPTTTVISNPLDAISNALLGRILDAINPVLGAVNRVDDALGGRLKDQFAQTVKALVDPAGRITQELAEGITGLIPGALQLAARAAESAAAATREIIEKSTTLGELGPFLVNMLKGEKGPFIGLLEQIGTTVIGPQVRGFLETLEHEEPDLVTRLTEEALEAQNLSPLARQLLGAMHDRGAPIWAFVIPFILGGLTAPLLGSVLGPEAEILRQWGNSRKPEMPPSAEEAATWAVRGIIPEETAVELAELNGFPSQVTRGRMQAAQAQLPVSELVTALYRNPNLSKYVYERLQRLGYDAETSTLAVTLGEVLAPAQDVIRFAVREVFDPVRRAALTLDEDFPPAFAAAAAKLGMAEETARDYWAAHWELPGPNQVYAMLHRGLLEPPDVEAYLKAADFAPIWRAKLLELSYDVLTRVDIRRIHKSLGKDRAWLDEQHRRLGYSPETVPLLSDFVEELNREDKKLERRPLVEGLKSRIITAVIAGMLGEEEARTYLRDLEYSDDEIDALFAEGRLLRQGRRGERIGELIGDLYVKRIWTKDRAREELGLRGFVAGEIEDRFREWDLELELRAPVERMIADRDLTKTEVLAARQAKIVGDQEARDELLELRYDPDEIDVLFALDDYKAARATREAEVDVVHRRYVAAKIDETEASLELDRLGIEAKRRDALLAKWETEKKARTADLPVGTVKDLFVRKIWTEAEAREYLGELGYDDRERLALLRLWGAVGAEREAREAAKKK